MKIETKFKVNDLLRYKFEKETELGLQALEVIEVTTQTCYAETQVFYLCRPLILMKIYKNEYSKDELKEWRVAHGIGNDDNRTGYKKYREDELVMLEKEYVKIITSIK